MERRAACTNCTVPISVLDEMCVSARDIGTIHAQLTHTPLLVPFASISSGKDERINRDEFYYLS